jgi:hypothetical protein
VGRRSVANARACDLPQCRGDAFANTVHADLDRRTKSKRQAMPKKTEVLTARVTPEFKRALAAAAAHEHRSQAGFLEHLVLEYCRRYQLGSWSEGRATRRPRRAVE